MYTIVIHFEWCKYLVKNPQHFEWIVDKIKKIVTMCNQEIISFTFITYYMIQYFWNPYNLMLIKKFWFQEYCFSFE